MSLADEYCANMIRQISGRKDKTITQEELDEYINNAKDMHMSNVQVILCLEKNNIKVAPSYVRKPLSMQLTNKAEDFDNICNNMIIQLNGRTTINQDEFDKFVNDSNGLSRFEVLRCLKAKGINVTSFTSQLPPSIKSTPRISQPIPTHIRQPPSIKSTPRISQPIPTHIRQPSSTNKYEYFNNMCKHMVAELNGRTTINQDEFDNFVNASNGLSRFEVSRCLRDKGIHVTSFTSPSVKPSSTNKWTNPLDNPAFHDDNVNNPVCPHRVGQRVKVGNPLKQNEECKKCMYEVVVGDKNGVYCDDEVALNKKYLKYKSKYLELKKKLNL